MSINFSTLKGLAIPEGNVTQIADAAGNVLWSAVKKVVVTIEGSGSTYAYVEIDGVQYNTATTVEVPIGAVISCVTNPTDGTQGSSIIRVDYRTAAQGVKATYDYTVISDATITLSYFAPHNSMPEYYAGRIEIVDANAPQTATVTIARTGVTSGGNVGSVRIDEYPWVVSTSVDVPLGTVVICNAPGTTHSMYGKFGGQITLNGTVVTAAGNSNSYEYTVNGDVQIDLVGVGSPTGVLANIDITEL